MLTDVPDPDRIDLLLGFAHRVRQGDYGDGAQVRAGSVQVALRAIGKTFELEGLPNPTYRSKGNTGSASNASSKRTDAKIPRPNTNSPSQSP